MKTKLIIALVFAFGMLQSCKTPKPPIEESGGALEDVSTGQVERFIGTVHMDEKCGVTVEVIQGDVIKYFSPTNLEEKYMKEGMKIRFNSVTTATKMEGDCFVYEIIDVSEVSAVR